MLKRIYVPRKITERSLQIAEILVARDTRVYRDDPLLFIIANKKKLPIKAKQDGWIRYVAVATGEHVQQDQLLLIIDVIDIGDYRPDEQDVNLHTELGETGRRGLERELQGKHGKGYAAALFDAPQQKQGLGVESRLREHPVLGKMKESVPPKMQAAAAHNDVAVDRLVEDATRDPELQKQLSAQLQQELNITPAPSTAPQLKH